MYRIYSGQTELHNPSIGEFAISAKMVKELNTHNSLDMKLPEPKGLECTNSVRVEDDDGLIWRGRVSSISTYLDGTAEMHCEGALAYLCDTVLPPFAFRGTPANLFRSIVNNHNSQLPIGDERRFSIGVVSVTDPNNYINRSSESAMNSWEGIESRLIDSCGGYVYLSGDNLDVINYVADFDAVSGQLVHYAENLLDIASDVDIDGLVTVLVPYGAKFDKDDPRYEDLPTDDGFTIWGGNRLHLVAGAEDPAAVEYEAAVERYGIIRGTAIWDDITLASNLESAAENWLQENLLEHIGALNVDAADKSLIDASIDKIDVGMYVGVLCEPMDLNILMLCKRKETDLIELSNTSISLGKAQVSLTSKVVVK